MGAYCYLIYSKRIAIFSQLNSLLNVNSKGGEFSTLSNLSFKLLKIYLDFRIGSFKHIAIETIDEVTPNE